MVLAMVPTNKNGPRTCSMTHLKLHKELKLSCRARCRLSIDPRLGQLLAAHALDSLSVNEWALDGREERGV